MEDYLVIKHFFYTPKKERSSYSSNKRDYMAVGTTPGKTNTQLAAFIFKEIQAIVDKTQLTRTYIVNRLLDFALANTKVMGLEECENE